MSTAPIIARHALAPVLCLAACAQLPPPQSFDGDALSLRVRSSDADGERWLRSAERELTHIRQTLGIERPRAPLTVAMFRSRRELDRELGSICPKMRGRSAATCQVGDEFVIAMRLVEDEANGLAALRHELFHYLLATRWTDVPRWADEGLAQRFEPADMSLDRDLLRRASARRYDGDDLKDLVTRSWSDGLPARGYVDSWALASFLLDRDGGRFDAFRCYFDEVRSGPQARATFERCFGSSTRDLAPALNGWLSARSTSG